MSQSMSAMVSAQQEIQRSLVSLESGKVTALREEVQRVTKNWDQTKQQLARKREELEQLQRSKAADDQRFKEELQQVNRYTEKLLQVVMEKNPELLGFL